MSNARQALSTDLSVLIAAVVDNNPTAVNQNLQVLGLAQGGESGSTMKSTIDALFNSRQFAKAKQALNVKYIPGVLNLDFDAAAQDLLQSMPQRRNMQGGAGNVGGNLGGGNNGNNTAETINSWLPLVDHVVNFVCQLLGNCPPQQGNQQQQQAPFNWNPIYIIGGIFGGILLIGILVIAFKR